MSVKPGGSHATLIHGNWDAATSGVTWQDGISDINIPNSLYRSGKPTWFGGLNWPPYDPLNPPANLADALSRIPAGYRLLHDTSASVDTGDITPPTTPSNLSATFMAPDRIVLQWSPSTDDVGSVGYRVERSQGVGGVVYANIGTSPTPNFEDAGLPGGVTYNFRVLAYDSAGNQSAYSAIATATTVSVPDNIAPTDPTTLTVIGVGSNQMNLSWEGAIDNVAVTSYSIERAQGTGSSSFNAIAAVTNSQFIDTNLVAKTEYRYRIRAVDAAGNQSGGNVVAASTTSVSPERELVAAYSFNESIGDSVLDSSGCGNTGTVSGAISTQPGKYGGALSFNGTGDFVVVANSAALNFPSGMTLEAWIFPTSTQTSWRSILHKEKDAYYLHASSPDGSMRPAGGAIFGGKEQYSASNNAIPANVWTHIATTYDGDVLRIYINGVQVGSRNVAGSVEANDRPLRIGGNSYANQFFQGSIDEVRIYARALSSAEIQADMDTPIGPQPPVPPSGLRIVPSQ